MNQALKTVLSDWFLRGMIVAVALAALFPQVGKSGGLLHLEWFLDVGVAVVFFLHGMGIPSEQFRAGIRNWKLHLVVQGFTFVVFPLLFVVIRLAVGGFLPPMLVLGLFYLCVLPSTISSSVAMTGVAKGNVPAAIFNATISSLIGIVATPALVGLMAETTGQTLSFGKSVVKIATVLLLPFVLGQLLHGRFGAWFAERKKYTSVADRGVILLLVYSAFCDSVAGGLFRDHGVIVLLITAATTSVLLVVVLELTKRVARALGFSVEDEIVAVFCGSKKTLAAGVPMAKVLFGTHPGMGMIVLPIMFYHQLQLVLCALLAQRYAARDGTTVAAVDRS